MRAITGWEDAKVADPADDFAALVADASPEAVETVLEAYSHTRVERPDANLLVRARLVAELGLLSTLMVALTRKDAGAVEVLTTQLRRLDDAVHAERGARRLPAHLAGPGRPAPPHRRSPPPWSSTTTTTRTCPRSPDELEAGRRMRDAGADAPDERRPRAGGRGRGRRRGRAGRRGRADAAGAADAERADPDEDAGRRAGRRPEPMEAGRRGRPGDHRDRPQADERPPAPRVISSAPGSSGQSVSPVAAWKNAPRTRCSGTPRSRAQASR